MIIRQAGWGGACAMFDRHEVALKRIGFDMMAALPVPGQAVCGFPRGGVTRSGGHVQPPHSQGVMYGPEWLPFNRRRRYRPTRGGS
jgi:hypothetical protein